MTTTLSPSTEAISDRRLNLISLVLLIAGVTIILDTTIVNVALDRLHDIFSASVADTQWISSGYLLALVAVIPITGWASERFGTKRIWMTAVALFLLGSVLCGFAWDLPSLIGFRVLQGVGGGMVLPVMITILTQAAGPARIGRAITTIALPANLAPIFGPIIGGALIDGLSWHWLFFVNVPLCIAALALGPILLPAGEPKHGHRLDIFGYLLLTPGLLAVAFGVSQAATGNGFAAVRSWLPIVAGLVVISAFVVYSTRDRWWAKRPGEPLLDVSLFTRRSFGLASIVTFVGGFSSYAMMFLLPQFYQVVRGNSAFTTGLFLIPMGAGTVAFILLSKKLSALVPTRFLVVGGIVLTMLGILPYAFAGASGSDVLLLAAEFLVGFGIGAILFPITTLAFVGLARPEIPRGSAAFAVVQRVGAPFGVTVVAVILQGYVLGGTAVVASFGATFWWVLAFSAVPLVLAFFLPNAAPVKTATPKN